MTWNTLAILQTPSNASGGAEPLAPRFMILAATQVRQASLRTGPGDGDDDEVIPIGDPEDDDGWDDDEDEDDEEYEDTLLV